MVVTREEVFVKLCVLNSHFIGFSIILKFSNCKRTKFFTKKDVSNYRPNANCLDGFYFAPLNGSDEKKQWRPGISTNWRDVKFKCVKSVFQWVWNWIRWVWDRECHRHGLYFWLYVSRVKTNVFLAQHTP